MNPNGDGKRIQQLFREMRQDEERRTPDFASVLTRASSGTARSRSVISYLRLAAGVATICAALLIAMSIITRPSKPQGAATPDDQAAARAAEPSVSPSLKRSEGVKVGPRPAAVKRARPQRPQRQTEIAMKSLFAWQSPTASLLKIPDDELLRSLPRLGESLQTIKSFSPDQFN